MLRKHTSIDQLASQTMRQAQTENSIMQREIGKLRTSISSSGHRVSLPRIAKRRTWTKKTTNTSVWNDIEEILSGNIGTNDFSSSAEMTSDTSQSQKLSTLLNLLGDGQRLR